MQWNQNRWYNPATQRWLTPDPLGLRPDANPYRYCGNGPTNGTDPSGEFDLSTIGNAISNFVTTVVNGVANAVGAALPGLGCGWNWGFAWNPGWGGGGGGGGVLPYVVGWGNLSKEVIEARTQIIQQEAAAAARRYRQLLEQERQQAAAAARQRAQLAAMRQAAANQNAQRMVGSSGWTRFFGGVRMIGGVVECIIGVGGAAETAGVSLLVTAHGVDVAVAGFRQMVDGEAVDTGTSQLLQAAGMSQEHANIIDGGISIVGTSAVAGFTAPGAMAGSGLSGGSSAAATYPAKFMEGAADVGEGTPLAESVEIEIPVTFEGFAAPGPEAQAFVNQEIVGPGPEAQPFVNQEIVGPGPEAQPFVNQEFAGGGGESPESAAAEAGQAPSEINVTERGLQHVLDRHVPGGVRERRQEPFLRWRRRVGAGRAGKNGTGCAASGRQFSANRGRGEDDWG